MMKSLTASQAKPSCGDIQTESRLFAQLRFISDVKRVSERRVLWWGSVGNEAGRKEGRHRQDRRPLPKYRGCLEGMRASLRVSGRDRDARKGL